MANAYSISINDLINKPISFDTHAEIAIIRTDNAIDKSLYYERVKKMSIINGNVTLKLISDGRQDLWENNPDEHIQQLGNLIGVEYSIVVGRKDQFKKIEVYIQPDVIPKHTLRFSNIVERVNCF